MMSSQTRSHHNTTHRTGDRSYGDHGDEATSTSSVHYRLACERLDKIFARIPPLQGLTLRTGEPQVPVLSSSEPDRANSPPGAGDHARNNVNVTDGVVALPASNWVSTSQGLRVPQAATPFNRREPQVQGPIPYDIEYTMLRSELEIQKEQIRDEEAKRIPLDRSIQDLEETIRRQIEMLEANIRPGGEWKIRFDAQVKHNDSLEEEIARLEDQIAASDKKIKEATCIKPDLYPELTDADVRKRSRQGEKEKTDLQRRVKDYEWRLDNESKAFHTANEEKQKMILQVAELSKSIKKIGLEEADKAAVALSHHRVESEASAALGATVSGGAAKARKAAANPGRVDKSKTYPPPQSKPTKPSGGGGRLPK
ncbi:uncharacterized protein LOC135806445 [Sycon ciliatum]|uniref:uncharacterized protein LOC135806445 n=1 Tax=Sycon ciliatum TaxID=27933 RepID=UPI0031F6FE2A